MAGAIVDLKKVEADQVLYVELHPGDQARLWVPSHGFSGYSWYVEELAGGTVMAHGEQLGGQNYHQFNLIAFGPLGTSRVLLREARPFEQGKDALHYLLMYVTVSERAAA